MANKKSSKSHDFSVILDQSLSNKVVESPDYPLSIIEFDEPFPHKTSEEVGEIQGIIGYRDIQYAYSQTEIKTMLEEAVKYGTTIKSTGLTDEQIVIYQGLLAESGGIMAEAKACLDALEESQNKRPMKKEEPYSGPTRDELDKIINGGITSLPQSVKGFELKAHLRAFNVMVLEPPSISLNSPTMTLSRGKLRVGATGELWFKRPSIRCIRWCTQWIITWKWVRIARISVSVKMGINAKATALVHNKKVFVRGEFIKLFLDYYVIRRINLAKIANKILHDKLVYVYDPSGLVATIPVLDTEFGVDKINLPQTSGAFRVEIDIKAI